MKLGCHVSNSGAKMLLGAIEEAISYNANCFMIYLGAPQNSYRKPIEKLMIPEYLKELKKYSINPKDIIVHAPYIINLAQQDPRKRKFAVDFTIKEVKTTAAIGAKYLVIHPGALMGADDEQGLKTIAQSLEEIITATKDLDVALTLETMAGKGTEACYRFDHLRKLIDIIDNKRIKVCIDTCHTFDSGYDWVNNYQAVIDLFEKIVGFDNLSVFHINDSKNELGSRKDRHANIGYGNIGFETLAKLCHDTRFKDIPKILETPYLENSEGVRKYPPYKYEIEMLRNNQFNDFIERQTNE